MQLNAPELVATLARLHDAYERALAANDVEALNAFFWDSPHVVRYGVAEQLYGAGPLHAYRQNHTPRFTGRRLLRREITLFGETCASVMSEIELMIDGHPRPNRQSQTWIRFPELGWRIVAAHVSAPVAAPPAGAAPGETSAKPAAEPASSPARGDSAAWEAYALAAAERLALPLDPAHRLGVVANFVRTAAIAAPLLAFALPDEAEPAPVFSAAARPPAA